MFILLVAMAMADDNAETETAVVMTTEVEGTVTEVTSLGVVDLILASVDVVKLLVTLCDAYRLSGVCLIIMVLGSTIPWFDDSIPWTAACIVDKLGWLIIPGLTEGVEEIGNP